LEHFKLFILIIQAVVLVHIEIEKSLVGTMGFIGPVTLQVKRLLYLLLEHAVEVQFPLLILLKCSLNFDINHIELLLQSPIL